MWLGQPGHSEPWLHLPLVPCGGFGRKTGTRIRIRDGRKLNPNSKPSKLRWWKGNSHDIFLDGIFTVPKIGGRCFFMLTWAYFSIGLVKNHQVEEFDMNIWMIHGYIVDEHNMIL